MGRTRQTRKRHTRRKQKRQRTRQRRRTRHRRRTGGETIILGGGFKETLIAQASSLISGGRKLYPDYAISDIAPGDKRAMSSDRRKFKKWKKSLKRKSRKHKRKRRKH